jgi:hypothetical protein
MEFMPPAYVEKVGTRFPRFVMRDGAGQYFTLDGQWSENPGEAALFYSEADAISEMNRYAGGEHVRDTFTLKLVVTTDRDAWTADELAKHLAYFGEFHVRKNDESRGVVIEVRWNDLRKTP